MTGAENTENSFFQFAPVEMLRLHSFVDLNFIITNTYFPA